MKKGFMRFIAVFMIVLVAAVFLPALGIDSAMNIEASAHILSDVSMGSNIKWKYDKKTGTVTVYGSGSMSNFGNVDDPRWEEIYKGTAQRPRNRATKIVIENGITSIGNNAFGAFKELTTVSIPASVTSIGAGAFRDNAKLTTVTIPSSVKTIGDGAFRGCTELKSVTIPAAVTTISNNTFYGCSSLSSVNIHDNITSIGANAFNGTNVTAVNMPRSVKTIGNNAFGTVKITCNYGDPGYTYCQAHSNATAVLRTPELKINITPSDNGTLIASFYVKNASGLNAANFTISHNADIMPVSNEIIVSENSTSMSAVAFGDDNTVSIGVVDVREIPFSACTGECEYKVAEIEFEFAASKHTAEFEFSSSVFMLNNTRYTITPVTATFGEHIYERTVVAPTCTAKGYTTYTCICGDTYNADETAMIPHPYTSEVTTVATCNATGVRKFTCTECGNTYEETIAVDTANHVGGTELRGVATENCGNNGYTGNTYCLGCNTMIAGGSVIPATGEHSYIGVETTAATCNANGVMTYTCEVCFNTYDETIAIDADNHAGGTELRDAATEDCGNDGYTGDEYCIGCNTKLSDGTVIPATGEHGYVGVETTAATCNATGIMTYTCEVCFDSYEETLSIDADNHAGGTEIRDSVSGNCIEAGYTGDTYCLGCNTMIEKGTEVTATEHDYETTVYEATCTSKGYTEYTCKYCDAKYVGEETDMKPHTYIEEEWRRKEPTCTETGEAFYECKVCYADYNEILPVKEHNYTASIITTPATCTEKGYTTYSCICGDSFIVDETELAAHKEETIPAVAATCTMTGLTEGKKCSVCDKILVEQTEVPVAEHDYKSFVYEPTCKVKGYTEYTCKNCSAKYTDSETDMKPHTYAEEEWRRKEPTCTETGEAFYECTVCFAVYNEILPVKEHNYTYSIVTTPATCTAKGYTTHSCICGASYITDETELAAHTEKTISAVAATCTKTGLTEGKKCSVCDKILVEQTEIPVAEHDYKSFVYEPTCTAKGYTEYTCKNCTAKYTDSETDMKPHTYAEEEWKRNEPTCTETGEAFYECIYCYAYYNEILPVTEHDYTASIITTPATCTAKGYTTHSCICGASYVSDETEMIAHDYVETVNKPATCTAEGEKSIICSMCNDTKTEKIPAEGHTFDKGSVTAPTCTAQGYTTYRCEKCDYPEKRDVKAVLGHNYGADGKCTRCGATDNSKPAELEFKDNTIFKQNIADKTVLAMNSGTVAQVKQSMMNSGWEITDANGNKLADDKDLTTGCLLRSADGKQVYAYAILGDVNMDGKVTAADARVALRISAKLDTGTAVMLLAADCDGKERVTAADARVILRVSAKLQSF